MKWDEWCRCDSLAVLVGGKSEQKKQKKTLQKLCLRHPVIHDRPFQVVAHVVVYFYLKKSLVIIRKIEQFGFTIVSNMQTKWQIV